MSKINLQEPICNRNATANLVNLIMTSTVLRYAFQNMKTVYHKPSCTSKNKDLWICLWSMVIWLKLLCRKQFYFILSSIDLYLPIVISGKKNSMWELWKRECLLQMLPFPFSGQQIMSKIESFQNADFFISRPDHVVWPLIEIVSERRFQWGRIVGFGWEMRKLS